MRTFGISCRCCGWLAALAVGAFALDVAHAGGQGEKIQFSEPTTPAPVVASNLTATLSPGLNRLNPEPSGFRQAQEDLLRPLKEAIDANDPMHAVMSLPLPDSQQQQYQQQRMNRRAQKLLDQKRNWAFTDLDELYPEPTLEEALGVRETDPAALENDSASVIQKYYDRNNRKPDAKLGQKNSQVYDPRKDYFTSAAFKASVAAELPADAEMIFTRSGFLPVKASEDSGGVQNFGDPAKYAPSSADELAVQKHRAEFQHLLDPSQPATPVQNSLFADPARFEQPSLFAQPSAVTQPGKVSVQPYRSVLNPAGITDPAMAGLHSSVFDDPTAAALGLPNPTLTKPPPPTATATVDSIQNMLDPFTANMAKRKF